jgi:hypothetical protein
MRVASSPACSNIARTRAASGGSVSGLADQRNAVRSVTPNSLAASLGERPSRAIQSAYGTGAAGVATDILSVDCDATDILSVGAGLVTDKMSVTTGTARVKPAGFASAGTYRERRGRAFCKAILNTVNLVDTVNMVDRTRYATLHIIQGARGRDVDFCRQKAAGENRAAG